MADINHAERAHALLSASSAHRWMKCTASPLLEAGFPDTPSEYAKEGTLAHELAEMKVRNYFYTPEYNKRKMNADIKKLAKDALWQDEMMGHTDTYLDYARSEALALKTLPHAAIEQRVDLGAYIEGGFGTADLILISSGLLHVIDFKYGKRPVVADHNPQLMLYALGAYEAYKLIYPVTDIRISIVQPRLPDGISSWETTLEGLLNFGEEVKERAAEALSGEGKFYPDEHTCKFCRARQQCRARADLNIEMAFGAGKMPPLITDEEVGENLLKGIDVAAWLADLKDYALSSCLAGKEIPGWKAVEGRGSREWSDMDEAFGVLGENGIDEAILYERKPLTLAQVEKVVGKKEFDSTVGVFVVKKPGKPTLVKESDKRQAITNAVSAKEAFSDNN